MMPSPMRDQMPLSTELTMTHFLPGHFSTLQVASSDSDSSYHGSLRPFYLRDEMAGYLYKPKTVRDILTKSEIFYEHEIRAWRRYIVVPPGVDHLLYILLKFLQQRVEKRFQATHSASRPSDSTPALSDIKVFQPHGKLNGKWASCAWAWTSDFGFRMEKETRLQLSCFQPITGTRKLLYRGLDRFTYLTSILSRNPRDFSVSSSDFGDGIYYTDRSTVAM